MAVKIENYTLRSSDLVQNIENMYWYYTASNVMCLQWQINMNNEVWEENNSGALGNCPITDSFETDGDLLISVGYNDGFAIRKIADDGSMSIIYSDSSPAGGSGCDNFAISKTHKKVFVGQYNRNGVEVYDYSGCVPTGNTVIKEGVYTTSNSNLPCNMVGDGHANGFNLAGDYLYMANYVTTATMNRWDFVNDLDESLTVTNKVSDGYRGKVFYHEDSDKILTTWIYNGELWVTVSASTSGAECYHVNIGVIQNSNDIRSPYTAIVMNENYNHVLQSVNYGAIALLDITTPLSGTSPDPTIIKKNDASYNRTNINYPYKFSQKNYFSRHPIFGSDLITISSYADSYYNIGWYDQENYMPVGPPYRYIRNIETGSYEYDVEDSNNTQMKMTYSSGVALPITSSGTSQTYFTTAGYGGSGGYEWRTWEANSSGYTFFDSGQTIFGNFVLDDNSNVRAIKVDVPLDNVYVLSDTSIECFVSNDNGSSWEAYTYSGTGMDDLHIFNSSGNIALLKFEFTGKPYKSPHISGMNYITVAIQGDDIGSNTTRVSTRLKIKGKS